MSSILRRVKQETGNDHSIHPFFASFPQMKTDIICNKQKDSEVFKLKAQLEERLEAEKEWDEEKSRLVEKLKTQHEKSAEEIQGMLAKITQATERALQLEHNLHEKDDQLASATEEKEKLLDKLRSLNEQLEREIREKKELMAKVSVPSCIGA